MPAAAVREERAGRGPGAAAGPLMLQGCHHDAHTAAHPTRAGSRRRRKHSPLPASKTDARALRPKGPVGVKGPGRALVRKSSPRRPEAMKSRRPSPMTAWLP